MTSLLPVTTALLALVTCGSAYAGSVTVQAMDQDIATNRALSKVPSGKKVTGTSCVSVEISIGGETSYRCTATWD